MVAKFSIQNLVYRFSDTVALNDITLDIPANQITVVFGPSHAGKSTLLRCLNRLNDLIENEETELDGADPAGWRGYLRARCGCDRAAPPGGHGLCPTYPAAADDP